MPTFLRLARKHAGLLRGIKDSSDDLTYSRSVVAAARELRGAESALQADSGQ
jgi:hypothetical protein